MIDRLLIKLFGTDKLYYDRHSNESDDELTSNSIVSCDLSRYDKYSNFNVLLKIDKSALFEHVHEQIQDRNYIILNNKNESYYYVIVYKKIEK